jgi:hypothetical protein
MATNRAPTNPDALLSLVLRVKKTTDSATHTAEAWGEARLHCFILPITGGCRVFLRTFRDSELGELLEKDQRLRQALGFERLPHRTRSGAAFQDWSLKPNSKNFFARRYDNQRGQARSRSIRGQRHR